MIDTYGGYRARLVEHLRRNGITDLAVLRAIGETPRHLFVPDAMRHRAYEDSALPIGAGQTISQPSTQAHFLQALGLKGSERALEVGTGSGYQSALLSFLVDSVVTIERVDHLAASARQAMEAAGIRGVQVIVGDGSLGWHPNAPYDVVLVAAAGPRVPDPLVSQLSETGRLIIPLQRDSGQELVLIRRDGATIVEESLGEARFVPLIGRHGFDKPED